MNSAAFPRDTLLTTLWPVAADGRLARALTIVVLGSLLLTLSAHVQIPFWPVPMTMQTFAVLVVGMTCGARLGGAAVALYLAQGAVGLPVFAGGAGLAYLAGPTGGYLAGFLLAALVTGWLGERGFDRSPLTTLLAMLAGVVIILGLGVAWLTVLIGLDRAIAAGLMPFLLAEGCKILLAAAVLPAARKLAGRKRR